MVAFLRTLLLAWMLLVVTAACTTIGAPLSGGATLGGGAVQIVGARVGIHPDRTRYVLELTHSVSWQVETRSSPPGLIITLPEVEDPIAAAPPRGGGLVIRTRFISAADGHPAQAVLDLKEPVRLKQSLLMPPAEGYHHRLVLDLEPAGTATGRAAPAAVSALTRPSSATASLAAVAPAPSPVSRSVPPAPAAPATVIPAAAAAVPAPPPAPPPGIGPRAATAGLRIIAIDPGHGGIDPGAIASNGAYEKTVTLAMAQEFKRVLEAGGRYTVILTRDSDVFIRLRDRVARARAAHAELFISLHADSLESGQLEGLSIYTLSDKASDREAEALAAKENRADAIAGVNLSGESDQVASILIDLAQRDTLNQSRRFAGLVLKNLPPQVRRIPRPQRSAGFAVLTAADIPSVLVELGYLSNPADLALLTNPEHRTRLAAAFLRTVDSWFQGIP